MNGTYPLSFIEYLLLLLRQFAGARVRAHHASMKCGAKSGRDAGHQNAFGPQRDVGSGG